MRPAMFRLRQSRIKAALTGALLTLVSASAALAHELEADPEPTEALALMGTIPVYWGEVEGGPGTTSGDFAALVSGAVEPHWARAPLEQHFQLAPLDFLSAEALAPFSALLMAQPRGLAPEENVALDAWVRAGGRLLLLADPAMTGHSHFGFGDPRRPQDTVLLSPILAHWGLELRFDATQPEGPVTRLTASGDVPVNLPGIFQLSDEAGNCTLSGEGVLASCRIGEGSATILADAALLDLEGPIDGAGPALCRLLTGAFGIGCDDSNSVVPQSEGAAHTHD